MNFPGIAFTGLSNVHPSVAGLTAFQSGNNINLGFNSTTNQSIPASGILGNLNFVGSGTGSLNWISGSVVLKDENNNSLPKTLNNGLISLRNTISPTINNVPSTLCLNQPAITLVGNPSGGTFSGTGVTGNSFDPSAAGVGTHHITYEIASNGCNTSVSATVEVLAIPTGNAGNDITICSGQTTTLSAFGGISYNWSNGSNGSIITVNPNQSTTYYVTIGNANGCSIVDSVSVFVINSSPVEITGNSFQATCSGTGGIQLQAVNAVSIS